MAAVAQISARQLLLLDLKLENVNNWAASGAVNLASDTTYATAGAVKKAYDLAAAALPAGANAVSASKLATARTISTTGDATGSASFDGTANAAIALTLANSGVTAGTYGKVTVDAKGRVTAGLAMVAADIPSLDWSKITTGKPTTLAGYGITDALGINANAVSASKLATARTLTVGGTGKAFDGTANLSWSLAEIGALPAAGGGIAGDFWRAAGDSRFGLVDHLGASTDAKACLVLLAKKYVGTLLNKTGFVGRILFSRVSVGLFNYTDFVDVSVTVAYSGNSVSLQRRSGVTVAAAKIVEVTYNSEVYFALYRPVASDGEVVATGHAFNAALPLLIPDATAYTITDVVTDEEDYHAGNKPTASDVGLGRVDNARQTRAEYLYGYWGLVPADGNASGWIRTPSQGLLPYQSGVASSLGSSSWQFLNAYVNTIYEGGTSLAAKYLGIGANAVSASKLATARTISTTGDATGSASFDGTANAAIALTLANSGVTAGTYGKVTVDAKGRVTAGLAMVAADIPSLDWSKITTGKPTTLAGYGITDALGINANAVSASKLATARTLTVGGTGKAFDGTANLSWSLAEIGALPAAGGGIAGDFWRAAGDSRFGLVDHLGASTDAKACLVLLAKKYVGTLLNKTGFVGRILFSRVSVGLFNYTDFVDVSVTVAYSGNSVSLQRRSGVTVAAAKIVEVTYNSEVYFALYRPVASDGEVVATGHAFNAALPLLIPDATAYTITDVVTDEEDYHAGNKPTASDVGLGRVDNARQTRAEYLYGYWGLVPADGNASGWIRTPSQGLLPYQSGVASSLGSSSWQFLNAYVNTIYEGGTSLAAKYLGIGANAVSASKWAAARTITLAGDATGSVSIDGSGNVTLTVAVVDNSHTHTAAQGNSDIVAGSYGQVGTYALASNVTGVTKTIGTTVAGSSLVPASAGDRHQDGTTLPGTWKCLGYSFGTGGNFDARITLWIRIA